MNAIRMAYQPWNWDVRGPSLRSFRLGFALLPALILATVSWRRVVATVLTLTTIVVI